MKYLKRFSALLICILLLFSFGLNATAYTTVEETPPCNFEGGYKNVVDAKKTTVRWKKGKPLQFSYSLIMKDYDYMDAKPDDPTVYDAGSSYNLRISSTLKISHTLNEEYVYTNKLNTWNDHSIDFEIQLLELPEKQIINFNKQNSVTFNEFQQNRITISLHKDGDETPLRIPAIQIIVINCQYGVLIFQSVEPTRLGGDFYWIRRGFVEWRNQFMMRSIMSIVLLVAASIVTVKIIHKIRVKKRIKDIQNQI